MKRTFARINGTRPGETPSLSLGQLYISGATAGLVNGIVSGTYSHTHPLIL